MVDIAASVGNEGEGCGAVRVRAVVQRAAAVEVDGIGIGTRACSHNSEKKWHTRTLTRTHPTGG
jgi:hypothetical protein